MPAISDQVKGGFLSLHTTTKSRTKNQQKQERKRKRRFGNIFRQVKGATLNKPLRCSRAMIGNSNDSPINSGEASPHTRFTVITSRHTNHHEAINIKRVTLARRHYIITQ